MLSEAFKPATSVLASTTPGYVDLSDELAFDQDGAADALDDAGWTLGADGIREKGGEKLSFDVVYAPLFTGSQAVLELTQQQLKAVGVDLQVRQQTPAEQQAALAAGDYDTYYYNVTRADGDILRTQFSSKFRNINKRPADTVLDPLLDAQLAQADPAKRADDLGDRAAARSSRTATRSRCSSSRSPSASAPTCTASRSTPRPGCCSTTPGSVPTSDGLRPAPARRRGPGALGGVHGLVRGALPAAQRPGEHHARRGQPGRHRRPGAGGRAERPLRVRPPAARAVRGAARAGGDR